MSATEILKGTSLEWAYGLFRVSGDMELMDRMTFIGIIYTIVVGGYSFIKPAPYGRYSQAHYGPTMNAKAAWIIQECPAFIIPLLLMLQTPCEKLTSSNANFLALMLFMAHYMQRSFIYPFRITQQAKPAPVFSTVMAFLFCGYNGLLQGHYLANVYTIEDSSISKFGAALFILGMIINIYHDGVLIALRKTTEKNDEGKSEYKIPRGGLFEYISGANYFGEILEWWALFTITKGIPQLTFAIFTNAFLGLRAWHHHHWYKKTFGDAYPANRKAFVPFIF